MAHRIKYSLQNKVEHQNVVVILFTSFHYEFFKHINIQNMRKHDEKGCKEESAVLTPPSRDVYPPAAMSSHH